MNIGPETLDRLCKEAHAIARDAGRRIVELYRADVEIEIKRDNTPVTVADFAAHDILVRGLAALSPSLPVLSEESEQVSSDERHAWPACWLVDPLDGTREFIRGNGEFTVNVALVEGNRPVLGIVHAPVLDVSYTAIRGQGARKQRGDEPPEDIHVRNAPGTVTVALSRSHSASSPVQKFLDAIGKHDEIPMGAALKSCLVAEGIADVYARLGPTGEWDTAAAQVIVEEAGGAMTDTCRRSLSYNRRDSLINPNFLVFGDGRVDWCDLLPREAIQQDAA
ncbi:MAG: 3'(2'),5'-bisphosphate nucleotidase [Gammaproteobacteria bacterium]|nr:MAG: 3'(2'),5'-bisphosphate nucleotidase [Gammaproteobacteria bacterium]PIE36667.1 MAG: 3'(2'),5'-bisphosphate nucleotidase [Gammaproteobacteria bacterium]